MKKNLLLRSACVLLLGLFTFPLLQAAALSELKEPLFKEAQAALQAANAARASLLTPLTYQEAGEHFQYAESLFKDSSSIESIQKALKKATDGFNKAVKDTAVARTLFDDTLQTRSDAENAEAGKYAKDDWRAAEEEFFEAAANLERNRKSTAERRAKKAAELFKISELEAIKANYLNETLAILDNAKDMRAKRYAPKSFASASDLLATASEELTQNRYDTDRPRNIAQRAKHAANHSIYVSGQVIALRDDQVTLEDILFHWEALIEKVANELDKPVFFDHGPEEPLERIRQAVLQLNSQVSEQTLALEERDAQISTLNQQLGELQKRLGGETEAVEALNQLLAKQEYARARFAKVERLFAIEEATILRHGNAIIIRMIGLNFDSGVASLQPAHTALLQQLDQALRLFPRSSIVVEGHTDSFGSDATNLDLSQRRADAVKAYLLGTGGYSSDSLTALGYGEAQPVANNETSEGRRRNRRIDIVIYPGD